MIKMDRASVENYLNHLTVFDGDSKVLTNIRPNDKDILYLCDNHANINVDILTAFYSPIDIEIEIIFTQNVIDLRPTNEYCQFFQKISANVRTEPICGPIILCGNAFTMIYIKSEHKSLRDLLCYGMSFDDAIRRIVKRHTILVHKSDNVGLQYENGFITCYPKQVDTIHQNDIIIVPNPYYE